MSEQSEQSEQSEPTSANDHEQAARAMVSGSKSLRLVYLSVGFASLALGLAGILLPLLPTTPFLLLTAACFMRGSPRFYATLMAHPWFGPYIANWRAGRGIPLRAKILAIVMMVIGIGSSAIWLVPVVAVKWLLVAIGCSVGTYILRMPTTPLESTVSGSRTETAATPASDDTGGHHAPPATLRSARDSLAGLQHEAGGADDSV